MMKMFFSLSVLSLVLACSSKEKRDPSKTDLPSFQIELTTGQSVNGKDLEGNVVLILFQPDCDHCQHEAEDIEANLDLFANYTLYFVTSATTQEVKKFATDYKLNDKPNVLFGVTPGEAVYNQFGPIRVPSIYIYSEEGKLKKSFSGQTAINDLTAAL
jgi:peroxiredoxin